jgi:putative IMPACT (imprinted ancient) family translation regulator
MSVESFQRITAPGRAESLVRRSRFIGMALAATDAGEIAGHLAAARAEFPKASHCVFAWRLLDEPSGRVSHRHDDDGEPGGTAGRPVLQVLENHDLVDALALVIRFFGGIKLGAGGLVRAYSAAAAAAVAEAALAPLERRIGLEIRVAFPLLSGVEGWIAREGFAVPARGFDPEPWLRIALPRVRLEECEEALRRLTAGRVLLSRLED